MKSDIKVSILCLVYNHEKFLRKCLDSLVNQKTNFSYEILIHDDASTDSSVKIIKEYKERYPEKIVAVLEKENQYSKGNNINTKIMFPKSKGEYIAFCEGDDCWCDINKLQRQFDYMEKHKEYSMCVHNTVIHDLSNKKKDKLFNNWKEIKELTEEEIFFGWNVHTTSYFVRRNACKLPEFSLKYWFGDYVRLTIAYSLGKIIYLPEVMSIYNYNNKNGIVRKIISSNENSEKIKLRKKYLQEFNEYTDKKYEEIIKKRIYEIDFFDLGVKEEIDYNEFKNMQKKVKSNNYYKEYMQKQNLIKKCIFGIRYSCYFGYIIIRFLKKIKINIKNLRVKF